MIFSLNFNSVFTPSYLLQHLQANMEQQSLLELKEYSEDEIQNDFRYQSRGRRRSTLNKAQCIITAVSFLLLLAMVAVLAAVGQAYQQNMSSLQRKLSTLADGKSTRKDYNGSSTSNLCLTPECIKAAADILSYMNENVDPCTDFYNFACGGWINRHSIPEDRGALTYFLENQSDLDKLLKGLLEKKLDGSEPDFVQKLKNMYETCMDIQRIEKADSEPLNKVLKSLGGWPVVEGNSWNETSFHWIKSLEAFRRLGYSHRILLGLSVSFDYRNHSNHVIFLSHASLGMPDRAYFIHGLNDSATAAYFNMMVKSALLLGADEFDAKSELMESLAFETTLAKISPPREESRNVDKQYNKYTIRELQQMAPQVNWLKYFNALFDFEIHENETLIIEAPDFVIKFADLITTTEKRTIANYMIWKVVYQCAPVLSNKWKRLHYEYISAVSGIKRGSPRWKACLATVKGSLDIALSAVYVRHYFDAESKEKAMELFQHLRKEFVRSLKNLDWIADKTKKQALVKANSIKPYIGYPEELLNDTIIQDFYKNVSVTNESFFDNVRRMHRWSVDNEFSELRKPTIKREWKKYTEVTTVNAFYKAFENSIEFLAGILRNGFFDKNRPQYLNFGAIGFVLAHELTHGFDDLGRQFEKDGNNVNWWDKKTEAQFKAKTQCIIEQFSNYSIENGMKVNGINTLGENIADNGGFKYAYKAYHSWVTEKGPEQILPGLNYSPKQLFWISTANIWCGKFRPETLKLRVLTGQHSPDNFRVNGGIGNLPEFSEEFNCPPNSPMNRRHKCIIW